MKVFGNDFYCALSDVLAEKIKRNWDFPVD